MGLIFVVGSTLIIAFRSRFSLDQVFFWSQICIGILGLVWVLFLIMGMMKREIRETKGCVVKDQPVAFEEMLTGPLGLRENHRSPMALSLEQKLIFLAQSMRPNLGGERIFRIGIKGSDMQQVVRENEPIFCHIKEHPSGGIASVVFGEGDVSMIPYVLDEKSLLLKVQMACGEVMEVLLKASSDLQSMVEKNSGIGALQDAKWLGPDVFFREYGGEIYRPLSQKQQIEVVCGKQRYVLYVGEKDFLSFEGEKWVPIKGVEEAKQNVPLACVKKLSPNGLEMEAWDEEGFPLFRTKLRQEQTPPISFVPAQVIQGAKLRSARQVSCKMGKKRIVLQPGDWLLSTQAGWHKLKTENEIDAFLRHELQGELCIIDGIDSMGFVKGHYFNKMRTQIQPFSFKAISSKGNKKGKGK